MAQDLQLDKRCHTCDNIPTYYQHIYSDKPLPSGLPFHNINELIQSAKKGCHVCNLILAELSESQIRDLQQELEDNPQHGSQQLSIAPTGIESLVLEHLTSQKLVLEGVYLVNIYINHLFGR